MARYKTYNGPMPTTAAQASVATGATIKTMLQLKPFNQAKIVAWGASFDGSAAATPVKLELLETGTVFATVTASVDADCVKMNGTDQAVASVAGLTMGTAATGYTASAEGTITATRVFASEFAPPTSPFIYQFPLGQEPVLVIGNATRIRVTAPATVNATCWIEVEI